MHGYLFIDLLAHVTRNRICGYVILERRLFAIRCHWMPTCVLRLLLCTTYLYGKPTKQCGNKLITNKVRHRTVAQVRIQIFICSSNDPEAASPIIWWNIKRVHTLVVAVVPTHTYIWHMLCSIRLVYWRIKKRCWANRARTHASIIHTNNNSFLHWIIFTVVRSLASGGSEGRRKYILFCLLLYAVASSDE